MNALLDISKLEAGRMEFNFSKINVLRFLETSVSDFKLMCSDKKIALKLENPENLNINLETDPDKLKRVLTNLISNAYKFTPENGAITVRIKKYKEDPDFLQFEIQDTGIGIPKKEQKNIFSEFKQVENFLQKTVNGTGLGLSIVKKIICKLGGKVWVESEEGEGSDFIFILPIKKRQESRKT